MTTQVTGSGVNFNGSTSGTILLTQPAVAGSNTITLPAETGTARTTVSSGTVLQSLYTQSGALATGTTLIPYDNTIPQNTEGDQYFSQAITPRSATNILVIEVVAIFSCNPGAVYTMIGALFQDSTANAIATTAAFSSNDNGITILTLKHTMVASTTSATTFKFRAGNNTGGTTSLNGQAGAGRFGGTYASSITITEVVP